MLGNWTFTKFLVALLLIYYPEWILFHNDGGFKFTDTADQTKLADYEFSWGCIFEAGQAEVLKFMRRQVNVVLGYCQISSAVQVKILEDTAP